MTDENWRVLDVLTTGIENSARSSLSGSVKSKLKELRARVPSMSTAELAKLNEVLAKAE